MHMTHGVLHTTQQRADGSSPERKLAVPACSKDKPWLALELSITPPGLSYIIVEVFIHDHVC